jgi:BirA family biotin operon repressor/biotin-[acetyl-CoA-carboxylase] ligase
MKNYKSVYYIHFDTIDSTNTWTKNNAHTLDPHQFTCVTAQEQTAGRGRRSRQWVSPKGQNIYATLYFCVPRKNTYTHNLGQVLSLSCSTVLKKKGFQPQIKWPNDLLLAGKKFAGILTETVEFEEHIGIVLGIGINVNMAGEWIRTIDQPATSLAQLSGQTWALEQILEPLLQQFINDLHLLQKEGFKAFHKQYVELLAYKDQPITCQDGRKTIQGIFHAIDEEGRLNLLLPSGEIVALTAGEITASES